jgi:drug/metabolite transporter (DMT)-like permease
VWTIVNFSINYALQTTSTASSLVILASNPMFSAIFSYFILRETIPLRTILTSLVCFASIVIIFYGQLGGNQGNVIGLIFALISAIAFGLYFVLIRYASVVKG